MRTDHHPEQVVVVIVVTVVRAGTAHAGTRRYRSLEDSVVCAPCIMGREHKYARSARSSGDIQSTRKKHKTGSWPASADIRVRLQAAIVAAKAAHRCGCS